MKCSLVTPTPTRRRFQRILMIAMGIYCLTVFAISGWFGWEPPKGGIGLYLAAISPALPIGIAILAMYRGLSAEPDEFFRMIQVKAMLIGTGVTMFICTAWGFLNQYAHVWAPPLYLVFPLWILCWALAIPVVNRSYR